MCYYNITTEINQDIKKTEKEISCYNECAGGINSDSLTVPNNMGGGGERGDKFSIKNKREKGKYVLCEEGNHEPYYLLRKTLLEHLCPFRNTGIYRIRTFICIESITATKKFN